MWLTLNTAAVWARLLLGPTPLPAWQHLTDARRCVFRPQNERFQLVKCCAIVAALLLACVAATQDRVSWKLDPATKTEYINRDGEVTADKAVEACYEFLRKCGMSRPSGVPTISRNLWKQGLGIVLQVSFSGDSTFSVDCKTGKVSVYRKSPTSEQLRGNLPAPPQPNLLTTRAFIRSVMDRIDPDSGLKIVNLRLGEAGGMATATADFQATPHGFKLRPTFTKRSLVVDTVAQVVLAYARFPDLPYELETVVPKLKASDAIGRAVAISRKHRLGLPWDASADARVSPARKSELMFVLPNGEMGGVKCGVFVPPARLRLAWVCLYGDSDEVWIDATDGRLLGGYRSVSRPAN